MRWLALTTKSCLVMGLMWLGLIGMAGWGAHEERETMMAERADWGEITQEAARRQAMQRMRDFRYAGGNYIALQNSRQIILLQPANPSLAGKDMSDLKNANGVPVFVNITKASHDGTPFISYQWPKPGVQGVFTRPAGRGKPA